MLSVCWVGWGRVWPCAGCVWGGLGEGVAMCWVCVGWAGGEWVGVCVCVRFELDIVWVGLHRH